MSVSDTVKLCDNAEEFHDCDAPKCDARYSVSRCMENEIALLSPILSITQVGGIYIYTLYITHTGIHL